ncbi:hypothetical protein E2P81_ATG02146 [Venturia nashicola]|nr:hypothetical protein E2P81_ATG02146 [Venturia nashicola]
MHALALLSFAALAAVTVGQSHYKHGPTFGWRRGKAAYVISAETTLTPGPPPNPQVPRLAVWPGMDTSGGLIQPIIVSTSQREYPACKAGPKQWCVFASYLSYPSSQKMGKQVAMDGDDKLRMKFQYNATIGGYEQWLYLKDEMVSYIGAKTGKAKGFYTDTECQGAHSGIVSAHEYYNTTIVLSAADPTWGPNPSNHMMACADKISTPDGGKTWVIPTIKVSQSVATKDFDGKNPPGPIICK